MHGKMLKLLCLVFLIVLLNADVARHSAAAAMITTASRKLQWTLMGWKLAIAIVLHNLLHIQIRSFEEEGGIVSKGGGGEDVVPW